MTNVSIKEYGSKVRIDITGHAGYNPGSDIVCAAVSCLSYTLMQRLRDMDNYNYFHKMEVQFDSGEVHIAVDAKDIYRLEVEATLVTILTGFELLENKYPDNIRLEIMGGRNY